jgi:uncharacterized protein (TIGR02266 family)
MTLSMPMVRIRLKCPDVDSFVDKYHADVNIAGIFVRTRSPLAAGTPVSFDFRLADDSSLFRGSGVVVWARNDDTLAPLLDAGMMLSFDELRDGTRANFERVLARKRTKEEAADTVPTLVRSFAEEPRQLPMTAKMAADEIEALRARMRDEVTAESVETTETAEPAPLLPTLVPSEPRVNVEALPLLPATPRTPLAKILVLPAQPARLGANEPTLDADDVTPLPPVAFLADLIDDVPPPRGDVTALVATPAAAATQATRLLGIGLAAWMLLIAGVVLMRLEVPGQLLRWLIGG